MASRRMVYCVREGGAYFYIFDSFVLNDHAGLNRLSCAIDLGREYSVGFTDDVDTQLERFVATGVEMFDLSPPPDRRLTIPGIAAFEEFSDDAPTPATFILPRILAIVVPLKHPLD